MLIDVDLVDIISGLREDTESDRDRLDFSIRHLGLMQPIVAVENPTISGRYICLAGRRRLLSHRRQGLGKVHATVVDADTVRGQLIEITENLVRVELSPLERSRGFKRYVDLWATLQPEAAAAMLARRPHEDMAAEAEAAEPPSAPVSALKAVARATGKSVRTIQTALARAEKSRIFTPDQVTVINASRISDRRIDQLIKIDDVRQRAEAVNLVGGGMDFPAAMREVLGDAFLGDAEEDAGLTDEEYLATCPIRSKVNQVKFDSDVRLWRMCGEARRAFARSIAWGKWRDQVGPRGIYFRRILLVLDAPAPTEWLQCHDCTKGITIKNGYSGECGKCLGCGYIIVK